MHTTPTPTRSISTRALRLAGAGMLVALGAAFTLPHTGRSAPALTDAQIVAIFDYANTADIETGSLAAERSTNKDVRDYGTMLSQVHTAVRQKGRDLAAKLGVTPATTAADQSVEEHAAVMTRLRALQGAEFDRAFLEHERDFHAAVLSAVKATLLPAIQNQELKDFVISLAPAFEAHRLAAVNLLEKQATR